jgi:hypothetical protein
MMVIIIDSCRLLWFFFTGFSSWCFCSTKGNNCCIITIIIYLISSSQNRVRRSSKNNKCMQFLRCIEGFKLDRLHFRILRRTTCETMCTLVNVEFYTRFYEVDFSLLKKAGAAADFHDWGFKIFPSLPYLPFLIFLPLPSFPFLSPFPPAFLLLISLIPFSPPFFSTILTPYLARSCTRFRA